MCKNLILLAQNDRQQMIFTCEHGTIHITHQKTTLCLTSTAFHQFTDLLAEGDLTAFNESEIGSVREGSEGQIELWIGSGGLRLHADEFFSLSDLLRTAARHLDRLPATRSIQPKHYLN
jgi:hypothetical protein